MEKYNFKEIYHKFNLEAVKDYIQILKIGENMSIDFRQMFLTFSPAELEELLEEVGWERVSYETNSLDAWIIMTNEDYDFDIVIYYNGYYRDLKLSREEKREYDEI